MFIFIEKVREIEYPAVDLDGNMAKDRKGILDQSLVVEQIHRWFRRFGIIRPHDDDRLSPYVVTLGEMSGTDFLPEPVQWVAFPDKLGLQMALPVCSQ